MSERKCERNIYMYWVGNEYKLIKILRTIIYKQSKNGIGYKVNLINTENINEYITVPEYFYRLCPANQADYVRVCVLYDKGGIWLDADTIVMESLDSLFDLIDKHNGFFMRENNITLCNGVFGTKPNTFLMNFWKTKMIETLETKNGNIVWNDIGSSILTFIEQQFPEMYENYYIFNGLDSMYPVNWNNCIKEYVLKPYDNYKNFIRDFQPLIILVNSVYKTLECLTEEEILSCNLPLNYFLNKALNCRNNNEKYLVLGDSHSEVFSYCNLKQSDKFFDVCIVGGATAQGSINPNSKTNALQIFENKINSANEKYKKVIIMLGEVDCGYLIWVRSKTHGISVDEQINTSVTNLFDFIKNKLIFNGYTNHQIIVLGSILPTIKDNSDKRFLKGDRSKVTASQKERTLKTLYYNMLLKDNCIKNEYNYLDITHEILEKNNDKEYVICEKYLNDDKYNHHLNNETTYNLWMNKVNNIDENRTKIFTDIYRTSKWQSGDKNIPLSGPGSSLENTVNVTKILDEFIDENKILSVTDLGCGDLTWIPNTKFFNTIKYTGVDIVEHLIEEHKLKYPFNNFITADIVNYTDIEYADFIILRDIIFHLKVEDVEKIFKNLKNKFKYIYITSSSNLENKNKFDKWHFSERNIHIEPFNINTKFLFCNDEKENNKCKYYIYEHDNFYNVQKQIIYIKTAKTGGTSLVDLLKQNGKTIQIYYEDDIPTKNELEKYKIIILAHSNTIRKFKEIHQQIYDNSKKIIIYRDIYDKILSSYNYLKYDKPLLNYLKGLMCNEIYITKNNKYDTINYVHFDVEQVVAMDIKNNFCEITNDPNYHVLNFKKLNDEVFILFSKLGFKNKKLNHLNATKLPNLKTITREEKLLIDLKFKNDKNFIECMRNKKNYNDTNSFYLTYGIEERLLFFDIFHKNNCILIICPIYNKINIIKHVNSIKIYNGNKELELIEYYEKNEYEPILIVGYKLISDNKYNNITVKYGSYSNDYVLENYRSENCKTLALTTLFKDDYDLINIFKPYYEKQGVEHFYMFYNGKLTDKIREKFFYGNITLIEWDFNYWNTNADFRHHAQMGQMHTALYKYGKSDFDYMIFCDLDEYMLIKGSTLKNEVEKKRFSSFGFCNIWSDTIDGKIPVMFPNVFKVGEKFQFKKRSKCIYHTLSVLTIGIHYTNEAFTIATWKNNYELFHFYKWSGTNRHFDVKKIMKMNENKIEFIHIGKCGGTTIESKYDFVSCHLRKPFFRKKIKYIIWIRNPIKRFVSAFNMQRDSVIENVSNINDIDSVTLENYTSPGYILRKKESGYVFSKELDEDIAFFKSANHLAESIYTNDENIKTKANNIMDDSFNTHINKGIGWYLYNGEFIKKYNENILMIGRLEFMDEDINKLNTILGVEDNSQCKRERENKSNSSKYLSKLAIKNLLEFYKETDYKALKVMEQYGFIDKETLESYYEY